MGLFDKKYCDICGKKIGLLGNNKLQDGNLCNECEKKLAVWFKDHRNTSVAQIQEQLKEREANAVLVQRFRPTRELGRSEKFIKIDESMGRFVILREGESMNKNPELLELNKVRGVRMEIKEDTSELHYKDAQGHSHSFNPRHYRYHYRFLMHMDYDGKWFRELNFPLSISSIDGGEDGEQYQGTGFMGNSMFGGMNMLNGIMNGGMGQYSPVQSSMTGHRSDLPGGYRQGMTNMKARDIQKYQELEMLGNEIVQYFMGQAYGQGMNAGYGNRGYGYSSSANTGYGTGSMNPGYGAQGAGMNPQMNNGYGNGTMNAGYGMQGAGMNPQMNNGYGNGTMNTEYGMQGNGMNPQMNNGYGNGTMNPGYSVQDAGMNSGYGMMNPGYGDQGNPVYSQQNSRFGDGSMNQGFGSQGTGYGSQMNANDNSSPNASYSRASSPAGNETWVCSCGAENTGRFCVFCGKPKP